MFEKCQELCENLWSNIVYYKNDLEENLSENYGHHWEYLVKEQAYLHGLAVAVISSVAAGYLFNCAKPSTAAIFGVVNYISQMTLSELILAHHREIDTPTGIAIIGFSGAIGMALLHTVCKTSMTYKAVIILAIACLSGPLTRQQFVHEDYLPFN